MSAVARAGFPINFQKWIEEHRHLLKPPVGNQVVWKDREFIIMVVGGPNVRTDYHVNESEEFFYQLEGEMTLKILDQGEHVDIPIRAGEIYLLPKNTPHSPRRPAGGIGLVVERTRRPGEKDGFLWLCESCGTKLHAEFLMMTDIVADLPPVFDRFYGNLEARRCKACGRDHPKPEAVK